MTTFLRNSKWHHLDYCSCDVTSAYLLKIEVATFPPNFAMIVAAILIFGEYAFSTFGAQTSSLRAPRAHGPRPTF